MKKCSKCQCSKPLSDFNKNKSTKDGLQRYCAECYKLVKRESYARHRERILKGFADRYKEDPQRFRARSSDYYQRNTAEIARRHADWRSENKELQSTYRNRRRALNANAEGSHTAADIAELLTLQKYKCACCRTSVRDSYHVDHVKPLSKGGGNGRENIQILCQKCNLSKSAKDPLDFMQSRGFLL